MFQNMEHLRYLLSPVILEAGSVWGHQASPSGLCPREIPPLPPIHYFVTLVWELPLKPARCPPASRSTTQHPSHWSLCIVRPVYYWGRAAGRRPRFAACCKSMGIVAKRLHGTVRFIQPIVRVWVWCTAGVHTLCVQCPVRYYLAQTLAAYIWSRTKPSHCTLKVA